MQAINIALVPGRAQARLEALIPIDSTSFLTELVVWGAGDPEDTYILAGLEARRAV